MNAASLLLNSLIARINISHPTLALTENGQRVVRDIHVAQICSEFNINEAWLRNGVGEMFIKLETFSLDEQVEKAISPN